jgi:hypothetical protein
MQRKNKCRLCGQPKKDHICAEKAARKAAEEEAACKAAEEEAARKAAEEEASRKAAEVLALVALIRRSLARRSLARRLVAAIRIQFAWRQRVIRLQALKWFRFLPISRILHVQANLGVGKNTEAEKIKCAVSKMLAVASCRWALSRSQHASVVFNECGWKPTDGKGTTVYNDPNGPIKLLRKFDYKSFNLEYGHSYNLIATDQVHKDISTDVCDQAAEKYAAEKSAAEKSAAECDPKDAGVDAQRMNTRNIQETYARQLALRFLAVKVGENPQNISATFHGTHKESPEQKQCNLRLILSALKDLGLPCVLSGDLNLTLEEIRQVCVNHDFLCHERSPEEQEEQEGLRPREIDHVLTFKPTGSTWRPEVRNLVRVKDPKNVLDHPILTFEVHFLLESPRCRGY